MLFDGKKFSIILPQNLTPAKLAKVSAYIGMTFGYHFPTMVGRDMHIDNHVHLGITTQNLPVLDGLEEDNIKSLRLALLDKPQIFVISIPSMIADCKDYNELAHRMNAHTIDDLTFWGLGLFGPQTQIAEITTGLKLYSKTKNRAIEPDFVFTTAPEKHNHTTVHCALANNLSAGRLANCSAILGISLGKNNPNLIGAPLADKNKISHPGLAQVNISLLSGQGSQDDTLRTLRESLYQAQNLSVVDVTQATQTTSYEAYLEIAESTSIKETEYWGIGIAGLKTQLDELTKDLGPFLTAGQEQELAKKRKAQQKWAARQAALSEE